MVMLTNQLLHFDKTQLKISSSNLGLNKINISTYMILFMVSFTIKNINNKSFSLD
jgi:hypothetical protein